MLRIVTGETNFLIRKAGNQEKRMGQENDLTANHAKLASQARHEMGAQMELFARAKRGA
jgi:hypothetical protein